MEEVASDVVIINFSCNCRLCTYCGYRRAREYAAKLGDSSPLTSFYSPNLHERKVIYIRVPYRMKERGNNSPAGKEDIIMKKLVLCIAFAFVVAVVPSNLSLAQEESLGIPVSGICMIISGACNHYWLSLESSAPGVYALHGYEYGCEYNDRLADGVLHIVGGYAYIGIVGSSGGAGDYGNISHRNYVIDLSTRTGNYIYTYMYLSGGVADGHGGSGTVQLSMCPTPKAHAMGGFDEALQ